MSDKYFNEAQRKILTVHDGDYISESIVRVAREIYDEAQALKPTDPRLSDDPLTALTAIMRHHNIGVESVDGVDVWADRMLILDTDKKTLTAGDIKPEK